MMEMLALKNFRRNATAIAKEGRVSVLKAKGRSVPRRNGGNQGGQDACASLAIHDRDHAHRAHRYSTVHLGRRTRFPLVRRKPNVTQYDRGCEDW